MKRNFPKLRDCPFLNAFLINKITYNMKKNTLLFSLLAIGIFFAACQTQAPMEEPAMDMDALKSEIQAMEDAYAKAENAKDVDGIMVYYADDAQSLPQNEPKVVGSEAIAKRLADRLQKDTSGNTIEFAVEELFVGGDYVVEIGSSVSTNPSGEKVGSGKYLTLFEKRGDKYVAIRDIWNSDKDDDDDKEDEDM